MSWDLSVWEGTKSKPTAGGEQRAVPGYRAWASEGEAKENPPVGWLPWGLVTQMHKRNPRTPNAVNSVLSDA